MEEEKKEETQVVKQEEERVPEAEAEVQAESVSKETDTLEEVCEELGIPDAEKEEGEVVPVTVPVTDEGKGKGTMVNVSRDTHKRLKLAKVELNAKSFDAVIRKQFNW